MYNLGDTSYKGQPKFMSESTVDDVIHEAYEYIVRHNIENFDFLFHGGEPMLASKEFLEDFIVKANKLEQKVENLKIRFEIQTNGVLIDKSWCDFFNRFKIDVGISVDGTKESHNKYRVDHKGKGSYDIVKAVCGLVKKELDYLNVICVIDFDSSPREVYENFKLLNVDSVNFLIPDYNYQSFPYPYTDKYDYKVANWLIELFELWFNDEGKFRIIFLEGYLNKIIGLSGEQDELTNELKSLVIETNGEIEPIDSLKACGHNFTKTGLKVKSNKLEDIYTSPIGSLYFNEKQTSEKCLKCPIYEICVGGRIVHRYDKETKFNNPSVYCYDLVKFIAHMQNRLLDDFPDIDKDDIYRIDYKEVTAELNAI